MSEVRKIIPGILVLVALGLGFEGLRHTAIEDTPAEEFKRIGFSIGLRDVSENMVQFILTGITFRIPISQLNTILENSPSVEGEIRDGFTMIGLWPGFEKKTQGNIGCFTGVPSKRDSVRLSVRRVCPALDFGDVAPAACDPTVRMQALYDIHGLNVRLEGWFIPAETNDPRAGPIPRFPGMSYQGFTLSNPNLDDVHARHLIYKGADSRGRLQFARCAPTTGRYHHGCQIWSFWSDELYTKLSINGDLIPEWQAIRASAFERLESYIVTDATLPPPPGIRWAAFP